jgi:hypothetical protein
MLIIKIMLTMNHITLAHLYNHSQIPINNLKNLLTLVQTMELVKKQQIISIIPIIVDMERVTMKLE